MAAGVAAHRAYALASARRATSWPGPRLRPDRARAARGSSQSSCSASRRGARSIQRLRRYQELRELDLPIMVFIGGATGTGKSTVATELRIPLRDHARHLDRLHPPDDARVLLAGVHAGDPPVELRGGRRVPGRRRPARVRLPAAGEERPRRRRRVVERALEEGWSLVLEGVHLVPGHGRAAAAGARRLGVRRALDRGRGGAHAPLPLPRRGLRAAGVALPRALRRHPPACRSSSSARAQRAGRAGDRERGRRPGGADGRGSRPRRRRADRTVTR